MVDVLKEKNLTAQDLFKICDKDKSMQIDITEFADMIKKINSKWTIKQVAAMREYFDSDHSGVISKKEFLEKFEMAKNLRAKVDQPRKRPQKARPDLSLHVPGFNAMSQKDQTLSLIHI